VKISERRRNDPEYRERVRCSHRRSISSWRTVLTDVVSSMQYLEDQRRRWVQRKKIAVNAIEFPSSVAAAAAAAIPESAEEDDDQAEARAWGFTGVPFDLCAPPPPELLADEEK
jgi:hypothetical protein